MKALSNQVAVLSDRDIDTWLAPTDTAAGEGWITIGARRDRPFIYLYPGSMYVSRQSCAVTTVLGSCVAVCLWDFKLGIGGANHFLLPYQVDVTDSSPRFGDVAVRMLIERLLALGCSLRNLRAKLFGGASVIKAFRDSDDLLGSKNAEAARELVEQYGIPIVTHDLGGRQGRKIIFHNHDGAAWVKKL